MELEKILHADVDGGEGLLAVIVYSSSTGRLPSAVSSGMDIRRTETIPGMGTWFLTPHDASLQVGILSHPAGHEVLPHFHPPQKRVITATMEALVIRSGRVRATFYSTGGKFAAERLLRDGDLLLILAGGHSFVMEEDTEIIEIKQGPYNGKSLDKVYFDRSAQE